MIGAGLATSDQAIFDLDFHAVMHWGDDPALEKHYVPQRSQRARSVLTFFAQDTGTHNLVYASADIAKATQAREAIAFCDHWKQVSGADPKMLVMDQKVTTQAVLGELDARGIKFLTLQMRSPALARQINSLRPADFTTVTLERAGNFGQPACPATTPSPPTSSSAASWKHQARSSQTATRSPSGSNAAPTHPSCARPASRPAPQSPGGTAGPSATSTPEPCAEPPAWKSALTRP
jgi:hypothetical protein